MLKTTVRRAGRTVRDASVPVCVDHPQRLRAKAAAQLVMLTEQIGITDKSRIGGQ
jgi:hypothetical protein